MHKPLNSIASILVLMLRSPVTVPGAFSAPHRPGRPGGARPNAQCSVDCGQIGIDRSLCASDHILSSSSIRLFVFLIRALLAKMDSSFRRRRTERYARFRGLFAWKRRASESYQTRDELYSYGKATPKEISLLRAFNPIEWWDSNQSVYGTLCLWTFDTLSMPRWLPSANGPLAYYPVALLVVLRLRLASA